LVQFIKKDGLQGSVFHQSISTESDYITNLVKQPIGDKKLGLFL